MKVVKKKPRLHNHKISLLFLCLSLLSWLSFAYIIFFVEPATWQDIYYAPFFVVLAVSIAFSVRVFSRTLSLAVLPAMGIIGILLLRFFGFKDWINSVLIVLLDLALIYFFTVQDNHDTVNQNSNNQTTNPVQVEDHASIKT